MSHLRIQRKRSLSPRSKLYSEESRSHKQKYSVQKIVHQNIGRRRFTTHNSPNKTQKSEENSTFLLHNELDQAKKAFKEKNIKKALSMFKSLSKKNPRSAEIPYYIGSCLLNQGQYEASVRYFRLSIAIDPTYDKNTFLYLAVCYKALQNFDSAITVLNQVIEQNPRFQQAFFYRGKMRTKVGQLADANQDFKKCLMMNNKNQLAYIFLGDNLKNQNKMKEAFEKYDKAITLEGKNCKMAFLKKIDLLITIKRFAEAKQALDEAKIKGLQSPIFSFYHGLLEYQSGKYAEAAIYLEIGLSANLNKSQTLKGFKALFRIAIQEKDFFEAQHLIQRAKMSNVCVDELQHYFFFIEGVNDIIKRKLNDALEKLKKVKEVIPHLNKQEGGYFSSAFLPYFGYTLFLQNMPSQALECYNQYLKLNNGSQIQQYNKNICEGIIYNKQNLFDKAEKKFNQAQLTYKKIEPIFFNCINAVQRLKAEQTSKENVLTYLHEKFTIAQLHSIQSSLFTFYQSLVALYEGKDALGLICKAIKQADEEISQYFYIKGLCFSLGGEMLKGLECLNKAIQLDHSITQFYKQRSKYFYALERYEDACEQIQKILLDTEDDEAKLLLTFYYYMNEDYKESYSFLKSISDSATEGKFRQFEEALNFRMGNFDECGAPGQLVKAIAFQNCEASEAFLEECKKIIKKREIRAEFTTYHFHLFLAIYYCYNEKFDEALSHLFGSLEEIQYYIDEREELSFSSETMLNEVKFNIIIVSLLKEKSEKKEETIKYLEIFISETENEEFLKIMQLFMELISKEKQVNETIILYEEILKISDIFPDIYLQLGKSQIKTKLLALYPPKLKFNIAPQFDDSFLYNFDLEKIDNKLSPPWFKVQNQEILFTDKIRNESVLLSETQKPSTPLLVGTPLPQNLKDKFKLDDIVEKKLKKLMKKK